MQFIQTVQAYLHPESSKEKSVERPLKSTATDPRLLKFAPMFVDSLPELTVELNAAASLDDAETMHRLLHDLKGSAGMYGFATISSLAASADETVMTHKSIKVAGDEIALLLQHIRRVEGFGTLAGKVSDKEHQCRSF
jgi:HPt (histidine-containing phosphotransfer) domain-containing protein